MNKYDAREICALFDRGQNIIEWINSREGADRNLTTAILYSYDVQAGSYVSQLVNPEVRELKDKLGRYLGEILDDLDPISLLDAGVGEATSLVPILGHMRNKPSHVLGFDLSLSRLLFARKHLSNNGENDVMLFTGALDRIPLAPASIDVVLTVHAIEPNHGYEHVILAELLRVARRHLVLVEPSYELASTEARARMERLGYVRGIPEALNGLGCTARRIERFPWNSNPLNEAALVIVDKPGGVPDAVAPAFVSPVSGRPLSARHDCWFSPDDGHAFPIIAGIPCLTVESSILASKLDRFDSEN